MITDIKESNPVPIQRLGLWNYFKHFVRQYPAILGVTTISVFIALDYAVSAYISSLWPHATTCVTEAGKISFWMLMAPIGAGRKNL